MTDFDRIRLFHNEFDAFRSLESKVLQSGLDNLLFQQLKLSAQHLQRLASQLPSIPSVHPIIQHVNKGFQEVTSDRITGLKRKRRERPSKQVGEKHPRIEE